MDKTAAVQSVINITYPVLLKPGSQDAIKASVMRTLLGGYFSSRLNANLREDKGYTYGARAVLNSDPVIGYFNKDIFIHIVEANPSKATLRSVFYGVINF